MDEERPKASGPAPASGAAPAADRVGPPTIPSIALPKGGGAIRGIDEKFAVSPATGTCSFSVPLPLTPGRSGFSPRLALSYNSGAGNGLFGLGWSLSLPSISRKTDKELPRYGEDDTFLLSEAEDLVPALVRQGDEWKEDVRRTADSLFIVLRYRPRIEGVFARIERWTSRETGDVHWRSVTRDNAVTVYGRSPAARIADPADPRRVFQWLIEESRDPNGNIISYEYKAEDGKGVDPASPWERNRRAGGGFPNRHIKRIKYGNARPHEARDWLFEAVFDHGDHAADDPWEESEWPARPDPFSNGRPGFDLRTYRLCRRVLMFHHFPELGPGPCLVSSLDLSHAPDSAASRLVSMMRVGYIRKDGVYEEKSMPPLEFRYTEASPDERVHSVPPASLENLPEGLGAGYEWTDLEGEGVAGVLTEQAGGWFYKSNMGGGRLAPARQVAAKPSVADLRGGGQRLMDLAGDGRLSLVRFAGAAPGFCSKEDGDRWGPFTPFASRPNIPWGDPNLRFIDLDGDGRSDLLISENEVFRWHPSLAQKGFGPAETVAKRADEEKGPALIFADAGQSIYLADMDGDGLTDIVRVRNGEVCYWPNLGYGRFGAKVTMGGAPVFDADGEFRQDLLRLADIDGSGPSDILYLGGGEVRYWLNRSGNSWSPPRRLEQIPDTDDLTGAAVVDLLGNGTACLVWSSAQPRDAAAPLRYIDLTGGRKPDLLEMVRNNLGAETLFEYAPSTKFSLRDKADGRPWATKLPFPVQVVERVEVRDLVAGATLITSYSYRHGHYDGEEREFRGFGFVEQRDAESFALVDGADALFHAPPVLTKTWFHSGDWKDGGKIAKSLEKEYYAGDPRAFALADSSLPPSLSTRERREAVRALKGVILRQEVYALDGSDKARHPYSVSEKNHRVRAVQPLGGNKHAVFFAHPAESLDFHYERDPADPRVTHQMTLEVDDFGNVLRSASIVYPRRPPQADGGSRLEPQSRTVVTCAEADFTEAVDEDDAYRAPVPCEERAYELAAPGRGEDAPFTLDDVDRAEREAEVVPFDGKALPGRKRLLSVARTVYYKDDLSDPLPLGKIGGSSPVYEAYRMAFTPGLVADVYGDRVTQGILREARYLQGRDIHVSGDGMLDDAWWAPSGRPLFDAATSPFRLPVAFRDPFGGTARVEYDAYDLLPAATRDALGNEAKARNDYRVMLPDLVTDPNHNRVQVVFDAIGLLVATAVMGKEGETDPDKAGDTVNDPTTRSTYGLFEWRDFGRPNFVRTDARERHGDPGTPWRTTYVYSDGLGREIQRKVHAEPGPVGGAGTGRRWVSTGWTVFNNKGLPVRRYEPFFSRTERYAAAGETGVSSTLFYDPLGRAVAVLHPDDTFQKVVFGPWREARWDVNDTVLLDPRTDPDIRRCAPAFFDSLLGTWKTWFQRRLPDFDPAHPPANPTPDQEAALKAAAHAGTCAVSHLNSMGRPFLSLASNGSRAEDQYPTETDFDAQGRPLRITDARGNAAMRYAYDMLGRIPRQDSLDAGVRWTLSDATGQAWLSWDGPEGDSDAREFRTEHDALRRPTALFVRQGDAPARLIERTVYGEGEGPARNLRGRIFQVFDGAGVVTREEYDFKGNLLRSRRELAVVYHRELNWLNPENLENEAFSGSTAYDALDRPVLMTTPDGGLLRPTYNEAGLLEAVSARLPGVDRWKDYVTGIAYDAKGRRERIDYGNGAFTEYVYDPKTFRLTRLTTRGAAGTKLQDLSYTYDPAGNVTSLRDGARQTVYFRNAVVPAGGDFAYDALYRLVRAEGREHLGLSPGGGLRSPRRGDPDDILRENHPHPHDGRALGSYTETYEYDAVGNILEMAHAAKSGGWRRRYGYAQDSNRLRSTSRPGEEDAPFSDHYGHDGRGLMTRMPHLPLMEWDSRDRLHVTDRLGGGRTYCSYDAQGQRVRKVIVKNGGDLVEERIYLGGYEIFRRRSLGWLAQERWTLHVMDGDRRVALVETQTVGGSGLAAGDPVVLYQFGNHVGSASLELDDGGNVVSYEEYFPYGGTSFQADRSVATVSLKRYRYAGKERDEETSFYYYGARYYAPWLGRWTGPDPGQRLESANGYLFVLANPIGRIENGGLNSTPVRPPSNPRIMDNGPFDPNSPESRASTGVQIRGFDKSVPVEQNLPGGGVRVTHNFNPSPNYPDVKGVAEIPRVFGFQGTTYLGTGSSDTAIMALGDAGGVNRFTAPEAFIYMKEVEGVTPENFLLENVVEPETYNELMEGTKAFEDTKLGESLRAGANAIGMDIENVEVIDNGKGGFDVRGDFKPMVGDNSPPPLGSSGTPEAGKGSPGGGLPEGAWAEFARMSGFWKTVTVLSVAGSFLGGVHFGSGIVDVQEDRTAEGVNKMAHSGLGLGVTLGGGYLVGAGLLVAGAGPLALLGAGLLMGGGLYVSEKAVGTAIKEEPASYEMMMNYLFGK